MTTITIDVDELRCTECGAAFAGDHASNCSMPSTYTTKVGTGLGEHKRKLVLQSLMLTAANAPVDDVWIDSHTVDYITKDGRALADLHQRRCEHFKFRIGRKRYELKVTDG